MALRDLADVYRQGAQAPSAATPAPGYLDRISDAGDQLADRAGELAGSTREAGLSLRRSGAPAAPRSTKIILNRDEGYIVAGGKKYELNAGTIQAVSELEDDDLPDMGDVQLKPGETTEDLAGFKRWTQYLDENMESSYGTKFWDAAKSSVGGAITAIPRAMGANVRNPFADSAQESYKGMSLEEQRGADQGAFDSLMGFGNAVAEGAGSFAPAIAGGGAVGLALRGAGAAAGAIRAGQMGTAMAANAGAAFSSQSESAEDRLAKRMIGMDERELYAQSEDYAALREQGVSHEQAAQQVAFEASRAAGGVAALLTLPETIIGGRMVGNLLRKVPGMRGALTLGEGVTKQVDKLGGPGSWAARTSGRGMAAGIGEGAQEVAESEFSQQAADRAAGFDTAAGTYANMDDFAGGFAPGLVLGVLGGGRRSQRAPVAGEPVDVADEASAAAHAALGPATDAAQVGTARGDESSPTARNWGDRFRDLNTRLVNYDETLSVVYGEDWRDRIDDIAQDSMAAPLLGQMMATQRELNDLQKGLVRPGQEAAPDQLPAYPGSPDPLRADPMAQGPASQNPAADLVSAFQAGDIDAVTEIWGSFNFDDGIIVEAAGAMGVDPNLFAARLNQMMDPANMDAPMAGETATPMGPAPAPPIPNLRERRAFQAMQGQPSEAPVAALPPSDVASIEAEMQELDAEIARRQQLSPAGWNKGAVGRSLIAARRELETRWEEAKLAAGPQGVRPDVDPNAPDGGTPNDSLPLPSSVGTPEPAAAPSQRAPTGDRPMGVAPDPIVNPDPMSPEEAASREQAQAERGQVAPQTTQGQQDTGAPAQVQGAAVDTTNPQDPQTLEPADDIDAQVSALVDPKSQRDVVFVPAKHPRAAELLAGEDLPSTIVGIDKKAAGVYLVNRAKPGGVLKAQQIRKAKTGNITPEFNARMLGITTPKADVQARAQQGDPVVAVQAKGADGSVSAEQAANASTATKATKDVAKNARPGDTVTTTTPQAAQQRRGAAAAPAPTLAPSMGATRAAPAAESEQEATLRTLTEDLRFALETGDKQDIQDAKDALTDEVGEAQMRKVWIKVKGEVEAAKTESRTRNAPKAKPAPAPKPKAELPPKAAAAVGASRERASRTAKAAKAKKATSDEEDTAALIESRAQLEPATLEALRGGNIEIPANPLKSTGPTGDGPVRLRTAEVDPDLVETLRSAIAAGRLTDAARAVAERTLARLEQVQAMIRAAAEAASERARKHRGDDAPGTTLLSPLTGDEISTFVDRTQAQLQHELAQIRAGSWDFKGSVARKLLQVLDPRVALDMNREAIAPKLIELYANVGADKLAATARNHTIGIRNALVAKQAVHGAIEVGEVQRQTRVGEATSGLVTHAHIRATESMTADMVKTLNGWISLFQRERGANVPDVVLMTVQEANQRYGLQDKSAGFTFPVVHYGKVRQHVIAIDASRMRDHPALALETMAHELGHVLTFAALQAADTKTQEAVVRDYERWLNEVAGLPVHEVIKLRTTGAKADVMGRVSASHEYATSFREYGADQIAKWLLTNAEPRGVVEQFFAKAAEFLKLVYEGLTGGSRPPVAWRNLMDSYLAQTRSGDVVRMAQDPWAGLNDADRQFMEKNAKWPHERGANPVERQLATRLTTEVDSLKVALRPVLDSGSLPEAYRAARAQMEGNGPVYMLKHMGLWLSQGHQIADLISNKTLKDAVRKVMRLRDTIAAKARQLQEGGNRAHELARALSDPARKQMEQVMLHATLWNIHPDAAFSDPRNAHLTVRDKRVTESNARRHAQLQAEWAQMQALSHGAAEAAYVALRDSMVELRRETFQRVLDNLTDLAKRKALSKQQRAVYDAKIAETQQALADVERGGPYFPLIRRGNWIVSADLPSEAYGRRNVTIAEGGEFFASESEAKQEAAHISSRLPGARLTVEKTEEGFLLRVQPRAVYVFKTEREAKAATDRITAELRAEYAHAGMSARFAEMEAEAAAAGEPLLKAPKLKDVDYEKSRQNPDPQFWAVMQALLKEHTDDPNLLAAYEQLYLESLPETSYRKSDLVRDRVLGASDEMLEGHGHRLRGAAYALAEIEHGSDLSKALAELKGTGGEGQQIANVMSRGQKLARERTRQTEGNRFLNFLTNVSSFFSLALSPAYVLTNAMQPFMVSLPVLASLQRKNGGAIGLHEAGRQLQDAYKQVGTFFLKRGKDDFLSELQRMRGEATEASGQDLAQMMLDRVSGGDKNLRYALEALMDRGRLDFSFLDSMEDALKGGYSFWGALQRLGMAFPQQVEAMNRVVTAIAAYNIGNQHGAYADVGLGTEFTVESMDNIVRRTQLDYSVANRPPLFNVPGLNVALQFKLYMQGMYIEFVRNGKLALAGATPADKAQGWAGLRYLLATHAAVGGVTGLGPIAVLAKGAAVVAAALFGDDEDEYKDGETLLRQGMAHVFGEDIANAGMRGLPTLLGVDMAERLGIPNLWDPKYAGISPRDTDAQGLDKMTIYLLGAPYANFKRVYSGAMEVATEGTEADKGKLIGMLPTFLRNIARAGDEGWNGIMDSDGDVIRAASDINLFETGLSAVGYQSAAKARMYNERNETRSTKGRIEMEREQILKRRRVDGDSPEIRDEIREFNRSVPPPFRITGETISRSVSGKRDREGGKVDRNTEAVEKLLDR